DEKDTDGDQITDDVEVAGFNYAGETWYLNPLDPDTNNDGLLDSQECLQQARENEDTLSPTGKTCQDTDGDDTPDVFDRDDDSDGVPDRVDLSPFSQMDDDGDPFDADAPLLLQVDDLQSDKPVFGLSTAPPERRTPVVRPQRARLAQRRRTRPDSAQIGQQLDLCRRG
ncbi:MAG: hypothetical protein GY833_24595, partial [Aestuariibacter sp.]|nr:hypothetical protein [Aestuariibacter sp.]